MAEQKNTVHTVFTGEANLSAAEAELREFTTLFEAAMGRMARATDVASRAADGKMLATIRTFNKTMGTLQQAQRTLQGLGVEPDRFGARNRADIKGEAASMAGDLINYRKTVSKALAGTVLELDAQITKLNDTYARLSTARRKNVRALSETQAEMDRLTRQRRVIAENPYVAGELSAARTDRAKTNLRQRAADDRMATRAAEELTRARTRLVAIENELLVLDARKGGRTPARIAALRKEQEQLRDLAASYESVTAVMQKFEQNQTRNLGKTVRANDREATQAARQYLQVEERVAVIKRQINDYEAGQLRMNQADLANLRTELKMSEQLLALHRQDADVQARANAMRKAPKDTRSRFERTSQEMRDNPQGLMGIQTEVMANYAALSAAQQGAYAIANFAVQRETALAQFRAIASASGSETARLSQDIEALGQNSKYTNLEIAETATLLAQAGLSARDTGDALKAISTLATAAGTELRQAADVVTSITNIWGYNVGQMGDIANVLTSALNRTKLGMDQIQLGIQYAGNVAADAGVDFVELTSIMGAMANAGIRSGSTIGTGLRALVVDLQTPTEKTVTVLERLGLSMADVDVRTLGLTQVLHNLKSAGFTSADAMNAFEIRAAAAFSAISNNLTIVDQLQGSLYGTDAAARANAVQMDTLTAKWTSFKNAALTLGADALEPVIEFLKEFLTFGTGVIGVLNALMPVVQGVTVALVAMFATFAVSRLGLAIGALGGMAGALRLVRDGAVGATVATNAFGVAIRRLPFVAWVGLLAGAGTALVELIKGLRGANDMLDETEGAINDLNSQLMESQNSIKAVDTATAQLTQRYSALSQNDVMRGRVLEQTRLRFESLGLKIDAGSDSVDNMLAALGRLRTELSKEFESQLLNLADRLQEKVDYINKGLNEGDVVTDDRRREALQAAVNQGGLIGQRNAFGPAGALIQDVLNGANGTNLETPQNRRAFTQARDQLRDQLRPLQGRVNAAPVGSEERRRLEGQLRDLRTFLSVANDVVAKFAEIAQLESERLTAEQEAEYRGQLGDPNSTASRIRGIVMREMNVFGPQADTIYRSGGTASERLSRADRLQDTAELRLGSLEDWAREWGEKDPKLKPFIDKFMDELLSSSREQMNRLFSGSESLRTRASAEGRTEAKDTNEDRNDTQDLNRRLATAERERLEARMDALEEEIKNAPDEATLARVSEEWSRLDRQLAGYQRTEANARLQTTGMYDRRSGLQAPVSGFRTSMVSSQFGRRTAPTAGASTNHRGSDIAIPAGTPVLSAGVGTVTAAGSQRGYGYTVEVQHANGLKTLYAHLSEILVKVGDTVDRGERLALSGGARGAPGSGTSTNPHLHFGVYRNGRAVNPLSMLGAGSQAAAGDPALARLEALENERSEAEAEARRTAMRRQIAAKERELKWVPRQRALKASRVTNNNELDSLLSTIETAGDETTQLADVVSTVTQRVADNIRVARELLEKDPKNADRLNLPAFREEVEQEMAQELIAGAEKMQKAYDAYIALQERLGAEGVLDAQQELRVAGGTAGTSETTTWLLNQRLEAEQYDAALLNLAAAQEVYNEALHQRALAEIGVAEATMAVARAQQAANDPAALAAAEEQLRLAEARLTLMRRQAATAGVGLAGAQRGVEAATPIGPLATNARTATAAGTLDPAQLLVNAVERYKKQSGVMTGVAQTVADGIYNSFSALGEGIERTINQIADGSITIQSAFSNIFGGILKEMQGMAAKIAANWIMQYILKMFMAQFGAPAVGGGSMDAQGMAMLNSGPMPRMKFGGETPRRFALGGGGQPGRDSVHGLLEPGEITMRKSAVDFIGRDKLLAMNALGNRRLSAAGAMIPAPEKREPDKVELYVVAPDQVPPPSEKQIIHFIGESIVRGELKKHVKTVSVGG